MSASDYNLKSKSSKDSLNDLNNNKSLLTKKENFLKRFTSMESLFFQHKNPTGQKKKYNVNSQLPSTSSRFLSTTNKHNYDDNEDESSSKMSLYIEYSEDNLRKMLSDLNLQETQIENIMKSSEENKMNMYKMCLNQIETISLNESHSILSFVSALNQLNLLFQVQTQSIEEKQLLNESLNKIETLKVSLRTSDLNFIELDGLEAILNLLNSLKQEWRSNKIHFDLIMCIKAILNTHNGRESLIKHESAINTLIQSVHTSNLRVKTLVLELLSAICYYEGGHSKVFTAIDHFCEYANEKYRFQTILNFLDVNEDNESDLSLRTNLRIATMTLLNALLCCGTGEKNLEFRLHLRYEFLMNNIQKALNRLSEYNNSTLEKHIEYFESKRIDDELQFASLLDEDVHKLSLMHESTPALPNDSIHLNRNINAVDIFNLLEKKLKLTSSYTNFLSILYHLLITSVKNQLPIPVYWGVIDSLVKQLSLHLPDDEQDMNEESIKLNLNEFIEKYQKQIEISELNEKIQKELDDLKQKLKECEEALSLANHEVYLQINKVDELSKNLQEELVEKKTYERQIEELQRKLVEKITACQQVPSDVIKINEQLNQMVPNAESKTVNDVRVVPPPPPPPFPAIGLNIPPPPPPMFGLNFAGSQNKSLKNKIPKPKVHMRCFNWTKIQERNYENTFWKTMEEKDYDETYKLIDLEDIERLFGKPSQPKRVENANDASMLSAIEDESDLTSQSLIIGRSNGKFRKEITVIESRRSNNCNILLLKLKLSNQELTNIIYTMDKNELLPKDMLEQLLKFVPTQEEINLLEQVDPIENLAKVDRFLYDMSKLFHYKQKLECLQFKKKFQDKSNLNALNKNLKTIIQACDNLLESKNIQTLLKIVLCIGNYMNQGNQSLSEALGFSVFNLNKLIDMKSNMDKSYSLLHFILKTIESKTPGLFKLSEDLNLVTEVSKLNMESLLSEVKSIEDGFELIKKEIDEHKLNILCLNKNDKFIEMNERFYAENYPMYRNVKKNFDDMKSKYSKVLNYFGEDEKRISFEEFFSFWNKFLNTFNEIQKKNVEDQLKKSKESSESSHLKKSVETRKFDSLSNSILSGDAYTPIQFGTRRKPNKLSPTFFSNGASVFDRELSPR